MGRLKTIGWVHETPEMATTVFHSANKAAQTLVWAIVGSTLYSGSWGCRLEMRSRCRVINHRGWNLFIPPYVYPRHKTSLVGVTPQTHVRFIRTSGSLNSTWSACSPITAIFFNFSVLNYNQRPIESSQTLLCSNGCCPFSWYFVAGLLDCWLNSWSLILNYFLLT